MPNILFISYDGMTDPLGQSQVLPYLTRLSKHHWHFTIISFEKEATYQKNKNAIQHICATANIEWIPLKYTKRPPVISTIWDYLKMQRKARNLYKRSQFDVVHCRSYISALVGLNMKKKFGTKFLFDMRGFWADERVDGNLWNLKNPIYRAVYKFFKAKERSFLINSDVLISLTQAGKDEMLRWNIPGLTPEKILIIPCAADFEVFKLVTGESRISAKKALGFATSDFVLSYIGSVGTWYLIEEMLQFFGLLQKELPNAKFLILTPDNPDLISKFLKKYDVDPKNVLIKFSERKFLADMAHASDMNIFFIKPAYSKISSSPTKMGEVLAMGIPIICNSNVGDVEEIIEQTGAGICIKDFKNKTMISTIKSIKNYHSNYNAVKIREKSMMFFDLQISLKEYAEVYRLLLNEKL
jgi:glycosyltransferase involved in cell wall biosynthesis